MKDKRLKWNPPGWPWELELITLVFFLAALLVPYYFHHTGAIQTTREIQQAAEESGIAVGRNTLSTQFGFLLAVAVVGLYVLHIAFAAAEVNRVTASPTHLFSPIIFAAIAYYRIKDSPGLDKSILSFVDGSTWQVVLLLLGTGLLTSFLSWLRRYRYMINFEDVRWDVIQPAAYDGSYFTLLLQLRPLLYAPRRYLACPEGVVIEGWFYAMPIGYDDIHSITRISGTGLLNSGHYYASSLQHLVRLELHDSIKPVYISPENNEEFVRYCVQYIARKRVSGKAPATKHGVLKATETHHGARATSPGVPSGPGSAKPSS